MCGVDMERIFKIFISATKQTLEYEREALINNVMLQNCIPVTMEYFVNPNNKTTLSACIDNIDNSDAVILILKSRYGSKIEYDEIKNTFPNGCPLKNTLCKKLTGDCTKGCKLSYTHFEYLYAKLKKKVIYVIGNLKQTSNEIKALFNDAREGCFNVYSNLGEFNSTSTTIISKIIKECSTDDSLGLVPSVLVKDLPELKQRVNFLESNFYNGFIPQKNLMGCLMVRNTDNLVFYVYKELKLKESRTGFDFSIHINIGDKSESALTKSFVCAHAYVKYKSNNNKFSNFYECQIDEKSYGHEYLNCHIDFLKQNNVRLPIKKGDFVGIFYTYKVNKALYGNEIGRQISPFFEETLVELSYAKSGKPLAFDCFEKVENNFVDVEGLDSVNIKPSNASFLNKILEGDELQKYLIDRYDCGKLSEYEIKKIRVPEFFDDNKRRRLSHFYVKWSD